VLVNSANAQPTLDYQIALKTFQASCDVVCPDVLCREPQIGNCVADPTGSGACR
jgi:hypothetical protein